MPPPPLTPEQQERYGEDRQPALYSSLIALIVLNNVFVPLRCIGRYRIKRSEKRRVAPEDPLFVLAGIFIDAIIGNLLVATNYGLGLHTYRVVHDDPAYPSNLSNVFRHVWITMVLTGPVFCLIKLTLLFFYRRLFLINQKWLKVAWWANMVYLAFWVVGSTGFYLFQCWPPPWYFQQYFYKYGALPKGSPIGQCNATTVEHVSIPLIFGVVQDFAILLLPVVTLWQMDLSLKRRVGLIGVFAVGILACTLDLIRIVQLRVNTDDKLDPAYGVAIFLVLSAASEVAAVICISLPVIIPWMLQEYRRIVPPPPAEAAEYPSNSHTSPYASRRQDDVSFLEPPDLDSRAGSSEFGSQTEVVTTNNPGAVYNKTPKLALIMPGNASQPLSENQIHVSTRMHVAHEKPGSWFRG